VHNGLALWIYSYSCHLLPHLSENAALNCLGKRITTVKCRHCACHRVSIITNFLVEYIQFSNQCPGSVTEA